MRGSSTISTAALLFLGGGHGKRPKPLSRACRKQVGGRGGGRRGCSRARCSQACATGSPPPTTTTRTVIVTSTTRPAEHYGPSTSTASSLCEAILSADAMCSSSHDHNIWIGGGAQIYAEALTLARPKAFYLTRVGSRPRGDTFFPRGPAPALGEDKLWGWEEGMELKWSSGHLSGGTPEGFSFEVWHGESGA